MKKCEKCKKFKKPKCLIWAKNKFNRIMVVNLIIVYFLLQGFLLTSLWMYAVGGYRLNQINFDLCTKMTQSITDCTNITVVKPDDIKQLPSSVESNGLQLFKN